MPAALAVWACVLQFVPAAAKRIKFHAGTALEDEALSEAARAAEQLAEPQLRRKQTESHTACEAGKCWEPRGYLVGSSYTLDQCEAHCLGRLTCWSVTSYLDGRCFEATSGAALRSSGHGVTACSWPHQVDGRAGEEEEAPDAVEDSKYAARRLVFGRSADAAAGIEGLIGMESFEVDAIILTKFGGDHLQAMGAEIREHGLEEDVDNWRYIVEGRAREDVPPHVQEQLKAGKYHGGSIEEGDFDKGHEGMTLHDFVLEKRSRMAGLQPHHVAALRFYTTSSYRRINDPLRARVGHDEGVVKLPLVTFFLGRAIKKLRRVRAARAADFAAEVTLYRGMTGVEVDIKDFKLHGGTEMAPISTTRDFEVARKYASMGRNSLIFKYRTQALSTGVSLQYLSVFPSEDEYLYPPGTFLSFQGMETEDGISEIVVSPQMP